MSLEFDLPFFSIDRITLISGFMSYKYGSQMHISTRIHEDIIRDFACKEERVVVLDELLMPYSGLIQPIEYVNTRRIKRNDVSSKR